MARNRGTVYLGYDDEEITDKQKGQLNYTVNKIGGLPDWPGAGINIPNCPICNLDRPLIIQIYAPLDNSKFHRTLYIFACINSSCSIEPTCWLCIRTQTLDKFQDIEAVAVTGRKNKSPQPANPKITWCSGADDWDLDVENSNEENGNVITKNDNALLSDDDDESNSFENDIVGDFENMQVDDKNANCGGAQGGGAIGTINIPTVFAEIEGEESEMVIVETPHAPERDLIALLKQTSGISSKVNSLELKSYFIAVDEERSLHLNDHSIADHVRELYQEYQKRDEIKSNSPNSPISSGLGGADGGGCDQESYEKAIPAHGDVIFHNFLSTIQCNPGQILRYSRDTNPLLIAPLVEPLPKCQNCGGECICEIQILSTLIPKLRLQNNDPAPIEYGNVLVYTCLKSCWDTPDKMRYETVLIQKEN